jgi:hypothetical protein
MAIATGRSSSEGNISFTGLLIGSSHIQSLVDTSTGNLGKLVLDENNLTFSKTVGRMNTLATFVRISKLARTREIYRA